ncbi:hypothetical protein GWI33_001770, partial [Rhynchophorus ferrugineus]
MFRFVRCSTGGRGGGEGEEG